MIEKLKALEAAADPSPWYGENGYALGSEIGMWSLYDEGPKPCKSQKFIVVMRSLRSEEHTSELQSH